MHVDTTFYPFEVQVFRFNFSKLYFDDSYQRNYYNSEDNVTENYDTHNFVSNGEWDFDYQRGKSKRIYIEEHGRNGKIFSDIIWQFEMKRGQSYYVWSFLVPAVALSFVSLLTFLLPVKNSDKLTLAVFSFVSIAIVIRLFNESLPSISNRSSYFGTLLSLHLGIAGLVIIVNVFISCCYHRTFLKMCCDDKPVPSDKQTAENMPDSEKETKKQTKLERSNRASTCDLCFGIFFSALYLQLHIFILGELFSRQTTDLLSPLL